jgi:hypothetical protein
MILGSYWFLILIKNVILALSFTAPLENNLSPPQPDLRYKWIFGDGQTEQTTYSTIIHRYEKPDTYKMKMEAYDINNNLVGSTELDVEIIDLVVYSLFTSYDTPGLLFFDVGATNKYGFTGQRTDQNGTCYTKGDVQFGNSGGQSIAYLLFYNCTSRDLLP